MRSARDAFATSALTLAHDTAFDDRAKRIQSMLGDTATPSFDGAHWRNRILEEREFTALRSNALVRKTTRETVATRRRHHATRRPASDAATALCTRALYLIHPLRTLSREDRRTPVQQEARSGRLRPKHKSLDAICQPFRWCGMHDCTMVKKKYLESSPDSIAPSQCVSPWHSESNYAATPSNIERACAIATR